jgi:hypothetical protein
MEKRHRFPPAIRVQCQISMMNGCIVGDFLRLLGRRIGTTRKASTNLMEPAELNLRPHRPLLRHLGGQDVLQSSSHMGRKAAHPEFALQPSRQQRRRTDEASIRVAPDKSFSSDASG